MEEMNFDEMRNQIAILKAKLDKQEIINDRMMRHVVKAKANNMKHVMWMNIVCAILVVFVVGPIAFHRNAGASWTFVIATDIMMIYCMVMEYLFKRKISDSVLMNASLLDVAKKMSDFKRSYKHYELIGIPIAVILVIWLFTEVFIHNPVTRHLLLPYMTVGLIIGVIISLYMYFRIQNSASDIIRQIEE